MPGGLFCPQYLPYQRMGTKRHVSHLSDDHDITGILYDCSRAGSTSEKRDDTAYSSTVTVSVIFFSLDQFFALTFRTCSKIKRLRGKFVVKGSGQDDDDLLLTRLTLSTLRRSTGRQVRGVRGLSELPSVRWLNGRDRPTYVS